MNVSIRKARQTLYNIDSPEAEKLRRDLFELENQDATLPLKFRARYQQLTSPKKEKKDMKQQTLEQAALNILFNHSKSTELNESIKIDWNKLSDDNILDIFEYAAEFFLEKFIEPSFDDYSEVASKYAAFTKSLDKFTSIYKQAKRDLD